MVAEKQGDDRVGKPYRPSNGSEGEWFMEDFCYKCKMDENESCEIVAKTMFHDIGEPGYPKEWVYDIEGNPMCTAFERHER
jgi:hypothetical protein